MSGADVVKHFHGNGASDQQKACDGALCGCTSGIDTSILSFTEQADRISIMKIFCY